MSANKTKMTWQKNKIKKAYAPDEDVIESLSQHAREVLVVDGVEELWLIHVAAEGVSHTGVSEGTEGTVQLQRVVMELLQVIMLRQLQDVQTPGGKTRQEKEDGRSKGSYNLESTQFKPLYNVQFHDTCWYYSIWLLM